MTFEIHVPAKCILNGEYSVIHQGFAIVSPFKKYCLFLKYIPSDIHTMRTVDGEGFNSVQIILWSVVSQALKFLGEKPSQLTGYFELKCNIPPCSGLGFSAALCLAVAEWLVYYGLLTREELFEFALKLEDIFHVKSSGVDVAGVMSKGLIVYSASHQISNLYPAWHPHLYVSNSGEKSMTKDCIEKINELKVSNPEIVAHAEEKMIVAVIETKRALESDKEYRVSLLADALNLGNECYFEWGLVSEKLEEHISTIKKHALACKVIGAGYGGHVLSLWTQEPPTNLPFKFYPLII